MKINLYYWNNGVGVVNHSRLIKSLLCEYDVISYDISSKNECRKSDLGIFIQNIVPEEIHNNKKNIYIVCEEWLTDFEMTYINRFDYVFVHSNHAKELLNQYHKNIINTGFFSLDRCFFPKHTKEMLHLKGKSIQKNTELVWKYKKDVNILDSSNKYLLENELIHQLNHHDIHICCSLYEAWGHYLWEAMSCGKLVICSEIPVFKEYLDPNLVKFIPIKFINEYAVNYEFLNTKNYKFRKGYFVDTVKFDELLNNKEELFEFQKKNCDNIRQHFLDVNKTNKQKFLETIKFIL
jgi:glycosyltransferase involved in cell wall biosynthesis